MRLLIALLPLALWAQDEPAPAPTEPAPAAAVAAPGGGGRGGSAPEAQPRPYDRVITKEAKTSEGLFKVHQIGTRYYYEIPAAQLGKEFLWVSQIARTTLGAGNGGQPGAGTIVVRWDRMGNRILLRKLDYEITADPNSAIAQAVEASKNPAIIMSFAIDALGPNDAPVIDVTRLFTSEVTEFSPRNRIRARGFDASRSFVERITPFPQNIEAEATQTFTAPTDPQGQGGGRGGAGAGGMRPGTGTIVVHYSMVRLPDKPMMPRLADARVGYFTTSTLDYSRPDHRVERRIFIARWRLEKKDPNAAVSEPVKPIVYYIDPATPKQWIPYLKRGIESWQPAFEAAGFKNAIIAKEAPTKEEDPKWSPEDVRYSVVRWLPSTTENASGPHISDPRSGEILNADIQFYHNVMQLVRDWYFVQVGPLDARAQKYPLPDDLMGELLGYVLAHEIGHTLGFQHNMKASSEYTIANVRDPQWVKKMGHTPTLMDYSRFNYVAQPEDKIDPKDLIPKIGPYDIFATHWGYAPISAKTPDDEKATLDTWAREQDSKPYLRFSTDGSNGADPGENTEAVGDADAVAATTLGLKNLKRVMDLLLPATSHKGEDWDELDLVYGRVLGQWAREMGHVAQLVGGYDSQQKHAGQDGVRFTPVPKARQQGAVKFLSDNAFATPTMFVRPEILRRIEAQGVLTRVRNAQMNVLTALLDGRRFTRLVEQETLDGAAAYRPGEFLGDLRRGIYSEMYANGKPDAFRRNLQRGYLEAISTRLNGAQRATDDQRPFFRSELRTIGSDAAAAMIRATDPETRAHWEDLRDQAAKILDPKYQQVNPAAPQLVVPTGADEELCFEDLRF